MRGARRPRADVFFTWLLRFFPREFRDAFGRDMQELFSDQHREARVKGGATGVAVLCLRTALAMAGVALLEHRDAFRNRSLSIDRGDSMPALLLHDVRYAMRVLRRSPVFTLVAALCISIGSGAVTTIFSAMNALVLRPLPGTSDPTRLVLLERKRPGGNDGISASYPFYQLLRDRSRTLDGMAAWGKASLTIATGRREGIAAYGNFVSTNFFSVLGVRAALGRLLQPADEAAGTSAPVIVLSHAFWHAQLNSDSTLVGKIITVNGSAFTLVGIASPDFVGVDNVLHTDAWVPITAQPLVTARHRDLGDTEGIWLRLGGRLKPGVTSDMARRELSVLATSLGHGTTEPRSFAKYSEVRATPLRGLPPDASGPLTGFLALLLSAAALVLLIASVNVASMLSARAIARRREMAVRAALGAGRLRIVRQLLTEILLLFAAGAAGGVAIAFVATRALEQLSIPGGAITISLELSPDFRVMAFTLALSLLTGVIFGLMPALQAARTDIAVRLRSDAAASTSRRGWLGNSLVVGQLAFSLTLLVTAGLFLRALDRGQRVEHGMELRGVSVSTFNIESWGYDSTRGRQFTRALKERLTAMPGVAAVSFANKTPLTMNSSMDNMKFEGAVAGAASGAASAPDGAVGTMYFAIDDDYFDVVRIPLVAGTAFQAGQVDRAARSAVVNETLARRYWPGENALGRTIAYQGERILIAGVARDAKYASLSEPPTPFVYLSMSRQWQPVQTLMVRSALPPAAVRSMVQDVVHTIDPLLPRAKVSTLAAEASISLLPQRVAAIVTGALGAVGLLLASVGLYGIMAYSTSRRTREIGLRMALGANRGMVMRLVMKDGMRLASVGVVIGCVLAAAASRLLSGFLFQVDPLDLMSFVGMSVMFLAVAWLACYVPARRAVANDPMTSLRTE